MTTIDQMKKKCRLFEGMTLAQVKLLVNNSHVGVDTDVAIAKAREFEEGFLSHGTSREFRIAVFLSGLMANLVDDEVS